MNIPQQIDSATPCLILAGGLGDILIAFDKVRNFENTFKDCDTNIILLSHNKQATELLKPFKSQVYFNYYEDNLKLMYYLENLKQLDHCIVPLENFTGSIYPQIENPSYQFAKQESFTIGIHPFGSSFSNTFLTAAKYPSKDLDDSMIDSLISIVSNDGDVRFHIFSGPNEKLAIRRDAYDNIMFHNNKPLWEVLAWADVCDCVIAADSFIKSYSAIKQIPTLVFAGNYSDPIRDQKFLDPYKKDVLFSVSYYDGQGFLPRHLDVALGFIDGVRYGN